MSISFARFFLIATSLVCSVCFSLNAHATHTKNHSIEDNKNSAKISSLPALAKDTTELLFSDFFKTPIGPRGLDPTEKLQSLNNKRVRIIGYMAQEDDPTPGFFMLTARPVKVGEKADGMADDLPAATLFVHMPSQDANKVLTYRPGPWVLTGTLQLGNQDEAELGRISFVRLIMEQRDIDDAKKK